MGIVCEYDVVGHNMQNIVGIHVQHEELRWKFQMFISMG